MSSNIILERSDTGKDKEDTQAGEEGGARYTPLPQLT